MKDLILYLGLALAGLFIGLIFVTGIKSYSTDFHRYNVKRVIDGDTFILTNDERIRLVRVDVPELNTYCGQKAKEFLQNLIEDKFVYIQKEGKDKYGRTLAQVSLHPSSAYDLEDILVQMNLAVYYHGQKANPNICDYGKN